MLIGLVWVFLNCHLDIGLLAGSGCRVGKVGHEWSWEAAWGNTNLQGCRRWMLLPSDLEILATASSNAFCRYILGCGAHWGAPFHFSLIFGILGKPWKCIHLFCSRLRDPEDLKGFRGPRAAIEPPFAASAPFLQNNLVLSPRTAWGRFPGQGFLLQRLCCKDERTPCRGVSSLQRALPLINAF